MDGYLEGSDNIAVEKYFDGPDSNNSLTDFWSDKNGVDSGNQDRDRITEMVEQADSSMRAYLRSSECNGAAEDNFGDRDGTGTGNMEQVNDVNAEKSAGDIAMWGNKKRDVVIHWFRRGLRLHDNPALLESLANASTIYFVYLLDPWFAGSSQASIVKWRFLLQCLDDLDSNLRKLNTRLYVIRGQAANVFPKLFKEWNVTLLSFEEDPEPYGKERDVAVCSLAQDDGVDVIMKTSHTLYDMKSITDLNGGNAPLTYRKFQKLLARCGPPAEPVATVTREMLEGVHIPVAENHDEQYGVPLLEELGFETSGVAPAIWYGGETEAVARLDRHLERTAWVANFERPKMTAQSLLPSQTCLTAYLRFGCLSARLFYWRLATLYRQVKQRPDPPISLHGQLMWREFFYIAASKNPNFDRMIGNPICVQIPWEHDPEALAKWAEGKTGFPWIDAIMTQLKQNGWIHPLARHAVACFLTRGDLWISWEEGAKVFEELLLDADWSVNAGMWLWLSCSSFFQPFLNAYCPVEFGKHIDPSGDYIRKYLPVLKGFSSTYIYEPWTAPEHVQKRARCIIGVDYPLPMVNHAEASQMNVERMKLVYQHLCMELGRQGSLTNLLSGNGKDLVRQLLGPNSGLAFKKKSESEST